MKYLLFILVMFLVVPNTQADEAGQGALEDLLKETEPIFYANCRIKGGEASLAFSLGSQQGGFFERVNGRVVNSANVFFKEGKVAVDEALGGVYTILRVNNLVSELLEQPFRLVLPQERKRVLQSIPKTACVDKPPM